MIQILLGSLVLIALASPSSGQPDQGRPDRWVSLSAGLGLAGGGPYATIEERVARGSVVFRARDHWFEISALGSWSEATLGCNVVCRGKPELGGAALGTLTTLGAESPRIVNLSAGVGAYYVPSGGTTLSGRLHPGVHVGGEYAFVGGHNFALISTVHVVVVPDIGGPLRLVPATVGVRWW